MQTNLWRQKVDQQLPGAGIRDPWNWHKGYFGGNKNVPKQDGGVVAQLCKFNKDHWTAHWGWVNFMVYKWYLIKSKNLDRWSFMTLNLAMISWIWPQKCRQQQKRNKLGYIKTKNFCASKDTINRVKRQLLECEKVF